MNKIVLSIALLIGLFLHAVQLKAFKQLSPQTEVMLFTCEPGEELYASFGHSALWIFDRTQNIDRLYNFGTFDFDTPGFYPKFVRGKLDYMLSVYTSRQFLAEYKYRKISVDGQVLNLKLSEKQKLYDLLEENCKPENRYYKYDFFMDNCATRIRDAVVGCTTRSIDFHREDENWSFRQMLFPFLTHQPWTRLGINIILGYSSDKIATTNQYQYLPEQMMISFEKATIDGEPLVSKKLNYLKFKKDKTTQWYSSPTTIFSLFLLIMIGLAIWEIKKNIHFRFLSASLFIVTGIAGLFLFFMWIGTDHSATNYNFNILWMLPHYLWMGFTIKRNSQTRKKSYKLAAILALLMAISMPIWPQHTEISFSILSLVLATRLFVAYRKVKN